MRAFFRSTSTSFFSRAQTSKTAATFAAGAFFGMSLAAATSYSSSNPNGLFLSFKSSRRNEVHHHHDELVAHCGSKAPDVPAYLIPYYLRDTKSRFLHYASIRDKKKGTRRMSPSDFLAAMLALPSNEFDDDAKSALDFFSSFFRWADADGDGTVSYREFAFLANVLAFPLRDLRVLFRLFDADNKGGVTPAQFNQMLVSVSSQQMRPRMRSGVVRAMFLPEEYERFSRGEEGPSGLRPSKSDDGARMIADKVPETAVCTFERFSKVVQCMERVIATAEFKLADKKDKGFVTKEEFGQMLLSSVHGRHLPFFLADNLRKLGGSGDKDDNDNKVTIDTYFVLNEMFRRADEVANALMLYSAAGYALRAPDLKRALDRCVELSRPLQLSEAELFVKMFDANSDGDLHVDEFITMLRAKGSYAGVLPKQVEKQNLFSRLVHCTAGAAQQARNGGVVAEES